MPMVDPPLSVGTAFTAQPKPRSPSVQKKPHATSGSRTASFGALLVSKRAAAGEDSLDPTMNTRSRRWGIPKALVSNTR